MCKLVNRMQKKAQNASIPLSIGKALDEALGQSWVGHGERGVHQLQRVQRKKDQSMTCSLGMFILETGSTD